MVSVVVTSVLSASGVNRRFKTRIESALQNQHISVGLCLLSSF